MIRQNVELYKAHAGTPAIWLNHVQKVGCRLSMTFSGFLCNVN